MREITLSVLFAIALVFNLDAQDLKQSKYLMPDAQSYNFGIVKQIDGAVSHTFEVKNTSDKNVVIYDVVPECSCTDPKWDEEPILPNKSSDIEVGFKADHYPGEFDKLITVCTSLDTFELKIEGKVLPKPLSDIEKAFPYNVGGIRFAKDVFSMNSVFDNKAKVKEFVIYNDSSIAVSDIKFENVPDYIQFSIDGAITSKQQSKITITYDPIKVNDYGYVTDYIKIIVGEYAVEMPVMGNVSPFIPNYSEKELAKAPKAVLNIEELDLGDVTTNTIKTGVVTITNDGLTNLKVMKVKPACKCLVSNVTESFTLKPNESKEVALSFDATGRVGKSKKSVYFYTNDPKSPAKIIKVLAKVIE